MGVTLWLAHPQPNIRTLIETVGLHRLPAPFASTRAKAVRAFTRLGARSAQRATMPLLLVLLFIVVPIAELAVLIQVGQAIGVLVDRSCC